MKQVKAKNLQWLLWTAILVLLIIGSSLFSITTGEFDISLSDIFNLFYLKFNQENYDQTLYMVITQIRWPRILLAIAVGGALSLSGAVLQGIYRNPLVEPYTLGISGGAALGVSVAIITGLAATLGGITLAVAGFIGSGAIIIILYIISSLQKKVNPQQMLLTGVMISFISSSLMMLIMSLSSDEALRTIIFWTMGSLDEPNMSLIYSAVIVSFGGLILSYFWVQPLNALRLGSNKAAHLGVNSANTIKVLFFIASILTGVSVAVAGVIGFIGLIIPQLMRILIGQDYRILLIASFLGGSAFLVISDTIARTIISPNELPVGVITGIIGGSIFIVTMTRQTIKKSATP